MKAFRWWWRWFGRKSPFPPLVSGMLVGAQITLAVYGVIWVMS